MNRSDDWAELDSVIQAALDLPTGQQRALIEQRLGARPDLLVIALAALSDDQPGPDLQVLAPTLLADATGELSRRATHGLIGQRVGAYELVELIGQGGMGSVFRARRADGAYEREVAIKLLPWSLRDEETERRFARECQLLAGLNHPGIAQLLDGGRTADGSPFLVMELVRGQSLLDYCDNRRLGLHARLELFGRLLTVVEFAHRHLIIHRDIKPANLLVTDDGQIKLLDFGIARLADTSEPSEPSELTRNLGQRLTPDYAAPEQFSGQAVTTATDVYALGCLLYRLLAGRVPLALAGLPIGEILERNQSVQRPALSQLGRYSPPPGLRGTDFGRDLDSIARKAVEPDCAHRYGSVIELAEEIDRLLAGLPVLARSGGLSYQAERFITRHYRGLTLTAIAFVTLAMLAGAATWQASQSRQQRDEALAVSALLGELVELSDPDRIGTPMIGAQTMLRAAFERASGPFTARMETRIQLLDQLASAMLAHEMTSEAVAARGVIHELLAQEHGADHPASLAALRDWALAERELYQGHDGPEEKLERVLAARLERYGPDHPTTAESLWDLGFLYLRYAPASDPDRPRAADLIAQALDIHQRHYGPDHALTGRVLFDLGLATSDPDLKLERLRRAIAIREASDQPDDLLLAQHLGDLALVLSSRGEEAEAIATGQRALTRHQAQRGELHRISILLMNNLAGIYRDHGRFEEALGLYRRVDELVRAVTPERHRRRAFPLFGMAVSLMALGDPESAEPKLRQAIDILAANDDQSRLATTHARLGDCLRLQSRLDEAKTQYEQSLTILEAIGRDDADATVQEVRLALTELNTLN